MGLELYCSCCMPSSLSPLAAAQHLFHLKDFLIPYSFMPLPLPAFYLFLFFIFLSLSFLSLFSLLLLWPLVLSLISILHLCLSLILLLHHFLFLPQPHMTSLLITFSLFIASPLQMRFVQNVTNWSAKKPAFYHGHVSFIDFARLVNFITLWE